MPRQDRFDSSDAMQICPRCNGTGQVIDSVNGSSLVCPLCNGVGRVSSAVASRNDTTITTQDNS